MSPDEQTQIYNRGFKAGAEHSQPSQETRTRLEALERMYEKLMEREQKDTEYHQSMLVFMAEFKEFPAAVKDLSKAVQSLKEWRATTDGERRMLNIVWSVVGTLATSAVVFVAYTLYTLDDRIIEHIRQSLEQTLPNYEFKITQ